MREALGRPKVFHEAAARTAVPGVATGLAVTGVGGDVLFVEAASMPGKGGLVLTGQLGDVMKESARIALTYVKSHALASSGIDERALDGRELHVHVPAGAIPKDGPSAGVTMVTAIASLLTRRPVKSTVGMTGEVTLQGRVLPIGGLKQKVLAAHAAGLTDVILPERNEPDLDDVPVGSARPHAVPSGANRSTKCSRWRWSRASWRWPRKDADVTTPRRCSVKPSRYVNTNARPRRPKSLLRIRAIANGAGKVARRAAGERRRADRSRDADRSATIDAKSSRARLVAFRSPVATRSSSNPLIHGEPEPGRRLPVHIVAHVSSRGHGGERLIDQRRNEPRKGRLSLGTARVTLEKEPLDRPQRRNNVRRRIVRIASAASTGSSPRRSVCSRSTDSTTAARRPSREPKWWISMR